MKLVRGGEEREAEEEEEEEDAGLKVTVLPRNSLSASNVPFFCLLYVGDASSDFFSVTS